MSDDVSQPMTPALLKRLAIGLVAVLAGAFGVYTTTDDGGGASTEVVQQDSVEERSTDAAESEISDDQTRFSELPTARVEELPPEAWDTLDLIDSDGPYPFDRDDLVFQNREAILPDRSRGHYREYTVITPGENDRGARRIVAGADGELYYTADHYESFHEIVG